MADPNAPYIPAPTEKQRTAYEMRSQGKTWEAIGQVMGCVWTTARDRYLGAVKRGMQPILTERTFVRRRGANPGDPRRVERMKDGEGMFDLGAAGVAEFDNAKFVEMAASTGIPPRIAQALARRIEANFGPIRKELKRLTATQEVIEIESVRQMLLKYMDEVAVSGASLKDIAITYGILVDKGQLLGGKPTQVFDVNLRAKLEVLMPLYLAEMKRRGITLEGQFTRVETTETSEIEH